MTEPPLFEDIEDETRTAIMEATFEALCEHGYANLTIDRIGEAFPKSKSLLYHHYDGKDDLLREFLDQLLARHEGQAPAPADESPASQLDMLLDHLLDPDPDPDRMAFKRAMIELRAQAAHDEEYREHFTRSDRLFRERFEDLIEAGVAAGEFHTDDPERVAGLLVTLINGGFVEFVTTETATRGRTREAVEAYLDTALHRSDPE